MNLDDLYDKPPVEIMLVGGLHDGKRLLVPEDRHDWLMPLPVNITLSDPEPDVTRPSMPVAVYRWTGSIRDDGLRVFQMQPLLPGRGSLRRCRGRGRGGLRRRSLHRDRLRLRVRSVRLAVAGAGDGQQFAGERVGDFGDGAVVRPVVRADRRPALLFPKPHEAAPLRSWCPARRREQVHSGPGHLWGADQCAKLAYMSKQDERVRFLAKLPPDLHHWLKVAAAEQSTDMNALLIAALSVIREREAAAQAIAAALTEAAIAEWDDDRSDYAKVIEIYVDQIAPIVARILKEGNTS